MDLSAGDRALYCESAEIHAAVHVIANIAIEYSARCAEIGPDQARRELLDKLIGFFAKYDRERTEWIETGLRAAGVCDPPRVRPRSRREEEISREETVRCRLLCAAEKPAT